jgi:hypothetical protein
MNVRTKKEVISFRDFMSRPATTIQKKTPLRNNIYSFFPPITIGSFFPVHDLEFSLFLLSGGVIVIIAIMDRFLTGTDASSAGILLSNIARVAFPVVGFGSVLWLLTQM